MRLSADFPCPTCGVKFSQYVDELIPGNERSCPHCHTTIKFSGDDGRKAQAALDGLVDKLKRMQTRRIKMQL